MGVQISTAPESETFFAPTGVFPRDFAGCSIPAASIWKALEFSGKTLFPLGFSRLSSFPYGSLQLVTLPLLASSTDGTVSRILSSSTQHRRFFTIENAHLQRSAPKSGIGFQPVCLATCGIGILPVILFTCRLPACLSCLMWDRHLACHSVCRPVRI